MGEVQFHAKAVSDVTETIASTLFYRGHVDVAALQVRDCVIIHSLQDVERFQDPDWPGAATSEPMNWIDIQGDTVIPYLGASAGHTHK